MSMQSQKRFLLRKARHACIFIDALIVAKHAAGRPKDEAGPIDSITITDWAEYEQEHL
jgi:hypothetical protein